MGAKLATTATTVLGAIASVAVAAPALADHGRGNAYAYGHRAAATEYVYARVVDVDPMVRYVTVNRPHEECWNDVERRPTGFGPAGQTAAGGVIGAAIGRQFGGGSGKDALTLIGAAAGAAIAHERAIRNGAGTETRDVAVQRCEVVNERVTEERIDGYLVTYVHQGRTYTMQTATPPGDRVRLAVDVRPVDYRYHGVRY